LIQGNEGTRTNIYVCREGLNIRETKHDRIGEIAFLDLEDVKVVAEEERWKLVLGVSGKTWEFQYEGAFGEHPPSASGGDEY
jgi:hypothetical protein